MSAIVPPLISGNLTAMRDCRYGRMVYLRHDTCVSRSIELYGEWSEGETALFHQLLAPGDVVVEVGANIGTHTVFLAKAVGRGGAVIAYEPQRFVFHLLCANIALNELMNVYPRHAAAGAASGSINVPAFDFSAENNVGGLALGPGQVHRQGEEVALETLDSLGIGRLKLLKVDAEGMEGEVLAGARDTIKRCRPILYLENDRTDKSAQLITLVLDAGYRLWWHLPPMYNPANFAGNAHNIFRDIVSINMLCMPRESALHIAGLREVSGPADLP